jgi:alpha-tubulin suppressor-like RCC1 family protein
MMQRNSPRKVGGSVTRWEVIVAGKSHTCAVAWSGPRVYCWGLNSDGQIGDGSMQNRTAPTLVSNSPVIVKKLFTAGWNHTFGAGIANSWAWGRGTSGQLGNGTQSSSSIPVPF